MDRNIQIEIKDRIAHLVGNPKIICGNNDYSVTFAFDDEWAGVDVKTLRVSYNNKYSDRVFTGDTVELPPIIKAVEVYLGVFAGDITSTRVAVRAEPSILCSGGSVADPEPDVYNQLIELINSKEPSGGVAVETDPTVPAWAKEPEKPKYTAEEVGAASVETVRQLSEEIDNQGEAIEGKQPKGDYALKNEIPAPYTLPVAAADTLGGVKVGKGLQMDGEVLGVEPENAFESIETIVVGYSLLAEKPDDWETNWSAYYEIAANKISALTKSKAFKPYVFYASDGVETVEEVFRSKEPNGKAYDFREMIVYILNQPYETNGSNQTWQLIFNKGVSSIMPWVVCKESTYPQHLAAYVKIHKGRCFYDTAVSINGAENTNVASNQSANSKGLSAAAELNSFKLSVYQNTMRSGTIIRIYGVRA